MIEPTAAEIAVRDPLTEVTRKERRALLGMSVLGIALVKTGFVPTKISALGIEFSQADQKSILTILAFVVIYFLVAFVVYATTDFLTWRLAFRSAAIARRERQMQRDIAKRDGTTELELVKLDPEGWQHLPGSIAYRISGVASVIRATFEFLLPIIVGIYAAMLLSTAHVA